MGENELSAYIIIHTIKIKNLIFVWKPRFFFFTNFEMTNELI